MHWLYAKTILILCQATLDPKAVEELEVRLKMEKYSIFTSESDVKPENKDDMQIEIEAKSQHSSSRSTSSLSKTQKTN